jgi:CHAD domain-containing protein
VHVQVAPNFSRKNVTAADMKAIAPSILGWQFSNASAESAHPMRVGVKRTFDAIITLN